MDVSLKSTEYSLQNSGRLTSRRAQVRMLQSHLGRRKQSREAERGWERKEEVEKGTRLGIRGEGTGEKPRELAE